MAVLKCKESCRAETPVVSGVSNTEWFAAGSFWVEGDVYVVSDPEAYALFMRFGDKFAPDDDKAQIMLDAVNRNKASK